MSSFMFVFLSGRDKGKTRIYHQDRMTIGTADTCDLVLAINSNGSGTPPPDILAQVKRVEGGCQFILKCGDYPPVTINGERIECESPREVRDLKDGDSIRFGEPGAGTELLFHLLREDFKGLQPVATNPETSMTPDIPGAVHPLTASLFVRELATSLWAEIPRRAKVYTVVGLGGIFTLSTLLVYANFQELRSSQNQIRALEEKIERDRQERESAKAAIEQQLRELEEEKRILEGNQTFAQRMSEQYSGGVCLIVGTYSFFDRESGKPLRYETADDVNGPVVDDTGDLMASIDGLGSPVEVEFTGTGFMVAPDLVLTNRHVVQPWWREETAQLILARGMRARIEKLQAYFPSLKTPFTLKVASISPEQDLALVRVALGDAAVPVLPLPDEETPPVSPGRAVVLLGYPTGVEALVERLPESERAIAIGRGNKSTLDIARILAERGAVRPLTTQGIIGDVVPGRIVHSADTREGGSGGPLFDDTGHVIGVNAAILVSAESGQSFAGSNFGVPIATALPFLKATQAKGTE